MSPDPTPTTPALTAADVVARLEALADPERAAGTARYFRAVPGGYGEGDVFLGVRVPQVRAAVKDAADLPVGDLETLLEDPRHEVRLAALVVMARSCAARRTPAARRDALRDLYLRRTDRVDGWDLVDVSAPDVLGRSLLDGAPRDVLDRLVASDDLWERRIALLATFPLIRAGQLDDTFRLAARVLADRPVHDLLQKAAGWMLREAGVRDEPRLRAYLDEHAATMPRTALRYALERLPADARAAYLAAGAVHRNG